MGNFITIPCDPCVDALFQCFVEKGAYIHNLEKNLEAMGTSMEDLRTKRDDLLRRVTREEERGQQMLGVIQVWLEKVETVGNLVDKLLITKDAQLQRLFLCGFCSKSLRSSYRYGKSVSLALEDVKRLNSEEFKEVVEPRQISEVHEIQLQSIIVGQEVMVDEAWKHLKDDKVGVVGMYGMGGVGKTTLLTQLNNKLSHERLGFDFVIWVVVSKELNVEKILNEIAEKIGLEKIGVSGEEWSKKDKSRKRDVIYNFLRKKKFMLFLDDIWEKVDLLEIGVPFPTPENLCKVAFTTRSYDVSRSMYASVLMEVQCLPEDEALVLFLKKVGENTLRSDPEFPKLAKIIAKECSGLPLALNVIGETMSSKKTIREWRSAVDVLTQYMRNFSNMGDKIFPLLKYSYDDLKGEHLKQSLLYCALFPEDYEIPKDRLVDYWIGEGIIEESEDIEKAEDKGYEIIANLVSASLLMEKMDRHGANETVSMHDVVREMALWIGSDMGAKKEAFVVHAGVGLTKKINVKDWNVVRRMSMMKNRTSKGYIHNLDGEPNCPELTTLLLQDSDLERISKGFFKSMPKLVVLDLSYNQELSKYLDGISELGSLQFLDLSHTAICLLPKGLHRLRKLIHLDLDRTPKLSCIAGISNLLNLKVLKLVDSAISWDRATVQELEKLKHLEILNTGFDYPTYLEQFVRSHKLTSCTQYLQIQRLKTTGIPLPMNMEKLRSFNIWDSDIVEIKMERIDIQSSMRNPCFSSLISLSIRDCHHLRDLTLLMFAPDLDRLDVEGANELEYIINKEKACGGEESGIVPFQRLSFLKLHRLPKLKSIYWKPLTFPRLKIIDVSRCPLLADEPEVATYYQN